LLVCVEDIFYGYISSLPYLFESSFRLGDCVVQCYFYDMVWSKDGGEVPRSPQRWIE